jgi:hypothetical protein
MSTNYRNKLIRNDKMKGESREKKAKKKMQSEEEKNGGELQ